MSPYDDGYEDGIAWKRMPDPKKHYYTGKDRAIYEAAHQYGQGDYAECYESGRLSVVNCEDSREESDFSEPLLFRAYLYGRRDELNA